MKTYTIGQMKVANKAAGMHWFSKDAMGFFQTKIIGTASMNLFITQETDPSDITAYTVRIFCPSNAHIITVGPFHEMTLDQARELKNTLVKAFKQASNREIHVLNNLQYVKEDETEGVYTFIATDGTSFDVNTKSLDPARLICG